MKTIYVLQNPDGEPIVAVEITKRYPMTDSLKDAKTKIEKWSKKPIGEIGLDFTEIPLL